jgi:hypothetical protein
MAHNGREAIINFILIKAPNKSVSLKKKALFLTSLIIKALYLAIFTNGPWKPALPLSCAINIFHIRP